MSNATDLPQPSLVHRLLSRWQRVASSTDAGAQRWRRILVSTFTSVAARGLAMVCTLLTVPLALHYLGAERYGIWMMLASSANLLAIFDLGLGVGLQNRIGEMLGRHELHRVAVALRSTFVILAALAALLFGAVLLVLVHTPFASTLFPSGGLGDASPALVVGIVVGAFSLGLPLGLFSRAALGLQHGWIASVAATCGTVCSLLAVLVAVQLGASFELFLLFTVVPPFIAHAVSWVLLARRVPGRLQLLGPIDLREGLLTLRLGSRFVLPQLASAVVTQSPIVLLGTLASPLHAATYSVLTRIALPFQLLQQMFLDQVWPAITESYHRGDLAWLRHTLRRLVFASLAFAALAVVAVAFAILLLFPLLTRSAGLAPTTLTIALFAANLGALCFVQTLAYISNGLARLRLQTLFALISLIFVCSALPLCISAFGLSGLLAALLALNLFVALPLLWTEYARFVSPASS